MGRIFSILFGWNDTHSKRKQKHVICAMGVLAILLVLVLDSGLQHATVETRAKVAESGNLIFNREDIRKVIIIPPEKKKDWKQVQPENSELVKDTLVGIASESCEETDSQSYLQLVKQENAAYQMLQEQKTTNYPFIFAFGENEENITTWTQRMRFSIVSSGATTGNAVQGETDLTTEEEISSGVEQQNVEAMMAQDIEKNAKIQKSVKKKKKRTISLSKKDKDVLLRIVEAEATGEDIKGRMLVANVVLNRVKCKTEFPDNVTDVVFEYSNGVYQFSPIEDGRYWSVEISDKTRTAVERVLCGEDASKGALYFMAREYAQSDNVEWFDSSLTWLFRHGTHEFFK